ncbi:MAG: phosphoenolpyruvate--protein phosphotransferase [Clostridia bacterium]|nr:phosphoenolpyruvate--protein phosphotransferase [Clostridia bacterium]
MLTYQGKSVFSGIAIGKVKVLKKETGQIKRYHIDDPNTETERFHQARETAKTALSQIYDKAKAEVGEANAAIFEIHQMMLDDNDYIESVENIIKSQKVNTEYAVGVTSKNFSEMFSAMDNSYMQARAADVKDISERLLGILSGETHETSPTDQPVILIADDLAPSETVQLDKSKILAFVTAEGSMNSHTAILARTMNIPAIVRTSLTPDDTIDGKLAIVDGFSGTVYIEPNDEILSEMRERQEKEEQKKNLLKDLKGKENITQNGKKIELYANIGNIKDLALVSENDAGGIGLFRSEFIYLERNDFPTEEEQFEIYKTVAETMAGKKVIIRTLDIGADKQAEYFGLKKEENPAMGLRAIRICLTNPKIFTTQLRAIFRAAVFGNISVMYPMITSVSEIRRIKAIAHQVGKELSEEGIPFQFPQQGIMIETPAAVIISDLLAREVDFFSIGTNDLTQYTLAIDRQNPDLDEFWEAESEALLRMIKMTVDNGHKEGIWVGICGELGADVGLTDQFLEMGIDELSVAPGRVLSVRKAIRDSQQG